MKIDKYTKVVLTVIAFGIMAVYYLYDLKFIKDAHAVSNNVVVMKIEKLIEFHTNKVMNEIQKDVSNTVMKKILFIFLVFFSFSIGTLTITVIELMIHEERMNEQFEDLNNQISNLKREITETQKMLGAFNMAVLVFMKQEYNIDDEKFKKTLEKIQRAAELY